MFLLPPSLDTAAIAIYHVEFGEPGVCHVTKTAKHCICKILKF